VDGRRTVQCHRLGFALELVQYVFLSVLVDAAVRDSGAGRVLKVSLLCMVGWECWSGVELIVCRLYSVDALTVALKVVMGNNCTLFMICILHVHKC